MFDWCKLKKKKEKKKDYIRWKCTVFHSCQNFICILKCDEIILNDEIELEII